MEKTKTGNRMFSLELRHKAFDPGYGLGAGWGVGGGGAVEGGWGAGVAFWPHASGQSRKKERLVEGCN